MTGVGKNCTAAGHFSIILIFFSSYWPLLGTGHWFCMRMTAPKLKVMVFLEGPLITNSGSADVAEGSAWQHR